MIEQLFLWMEDFDNAELYPFERRAQLEESVSEFNENNGTNYNPRQSFHQYESWQREKKYEQ